MAATCKPRASELSQWEAMHTACSMPCEHIAEDFAKHTSEPPSNCLEPFRADCLSLARQGSHQRGAGVKRKGKVGLITEGPGNQAGG